MDAVVLVPRALLSLRATIQLEAVLCVAAKGGCLIRGRQ